MKRTRKLIEIDEQLCNGCGECIPACKEGALKIVNGKARLISEKYCDGLGDCVGKCPTGALQIVERKAEEFDEKAVSNLVQDQEEPREEQAISRCPGTNVQSCSNAELVHTQNKSALSHWPVKIKLISPQAPFLQGAHLLVTADCVPIAYADYHKDFLQGKVALLGCPKFDDAELYVQKIADIFESTEIREVTVLMMEVPCCSGLMGIVQKGREIAGNDTPINRIVIGTNGDINEKILKAA